jgi:hypothetical protein
MEAVAASPTAGESATNGIRDQNNGENSHPEAISYFPYTEQVVRRRPVRSHNYS